MAASEDQKKSGNVTEQLIQIIRIMPESKQQKLLELLNEWNLLGQREHNRRSCLIAVDYSTQDRFFRDFIQDIGAGGIFIETRELFAAGQEIYLTFSIPNSEIPFRITGKVTRTTNDGIAVKFSNVTKYQEEILKSLVEKM
ncbi:MAG: PilZ domain-containing protein [Thermodesulfobacteriota bacterium]